MTQAAHAAQRRDYLQAGEAATSADRRACLEQVYEIAARHKLSRKALHAGICLADRHLSLEPPGAAEDLLRSFVACLYLAVKLEEVEFPTQRHFLAGSGLQVDSLVEIEQGILQTLGFRLYSPSAMAFFDLFAQSRGLPAEAYAFAQYAVEVVYFEHGLLTRSPSEIASSLCYLCLKAFLQRSWDASLSQLTGYRKAAVLRVSDEVCEVLASYWREEANRDCCVERKFAREQYRCISSLRLVQTAR